MTLSETSEALSEVFVFKYRAITENAKLAENKIGVVLTERICEKVSK